MKSIIYKILFSSLVIFLIACEKEYIEPNKFSDVAWYTSQFQSVQFQVGINDFISFSDVSVNTNNHFWEIEEGAYFLSSDLEPSQPPSYEKYIISEDLQSEMRTVQILFTESGMHKVRLRNEFSDSVANSTFIDGNYVLDTTFWVDVFDTIQAKIAIYKDGVEVPLSEDTIMVEAGGYVDFVDLTTIGRPNGRTWNIVSSSTKLSSTDSLASIIFNRMGVYNGYFTSSRVGEYLPGDWDELVIPNPIKVIQSTKPFELIGEIKELENEIIQLAFTGEFTDFSNKESFFTVMVNGTEFQIEYVSVNAQDGSILDIKMNEPIYRSDEIYISFDAQGSNIVSVDNRPAISFTNQKVIMHDINMLSEEVYGFEDGGAGWSYFEGDAEYEFTKEKAAGGDYSLKITRTSSHESVKLICRGETFNMEGGKTYMINYKIWVDPVTQGHAINLWLMPDWEQLLFWMEDDFPKGQWMTVENEYTAKSDKTDLHLMLHPYEMGTYYFDDFYVNEKEVRPE